MKKPAVPRAERITLNRDYTKSGDLSEYVMDVSQTGAFVRSNDPLPIGARLNVRFPVMLDKMEIVEGVAEVVRHGMNPRGMGLFFVDLTEASQDVLGRLVTVRRDSAPPEGSAGEGAFVAPKKS
jgi:hypothetical protein